MHGVGPGSVLAGRYTATLRTATGAFHERWRATDTTLERDVVLVCFEADAPVAAAALDAARRAAGVEDQRLVRVLDVGSDLGVSFIVEEPLTGAAPLSHLLQSGGLPADEVRRLIGETATVLEKASHRGLHHLALTPSCVLRMPDGTVKVRGLATEAALTEADDAADAAASRVDAVGLVKIAYAGLTGRWPPAVSDHGAAAADVGLRPAPSIVGGVAAPSEIAVGVPADLDLICRLTLNDDTGPLSPGDLAMQIAPWPSDPPTSDGGSGIDLASARDEATGRDAADLSSTRVLPTVPPSGAGQPGAADPAAVAAADPSATGQAASRAGRGDGSVGPVVGEAATGGAGAAGSAATGAAGAAGSAGTGAAGGAGSAATGLGGAGAAAAGVAGAIGDRVGSFARAAADKAAAKAAERRAAHEELIAGEDFALDDALDEAPARELEPPLPILGRGAPERPSNAQSRIALAIVGVLVLVALVIGVQNVAKIGQSEGGPQARPTVTVTAAGPTGSPTGTTTPAAPTTAPAAVPITIAGGKGLDLQDGTESDQNVKLVHDGNVGTMWRSRWYATDDFNGKGGLGVVLDLSPTTAVVREVELTLPAVQDVTVYAANSPTIEGAQEIGRTSGKDGTITLKAPAGLQPASKLLVWVTKGAPAEAANRFRAQISEVVVR